MKNGWLLIILFSYTLVAQEVPVDSLYKPDPHYLEDQLYFGISYIALKNLPEGLVQNGFSNAIKFGYIRDIPINERRNFGFGIGLGYSRDAYYHNLRISIDETDGNVDFQTLNTSDFESNSFALNKIDLPIEIRLRGSTAKKYRFWRLYAGGVISRVYGTSSNYVTKNVNVTYSGIQIINRWQYGLTLSVGYGTWNFNYYYGLSNIIKDGIETDGFMVKMRNMNFGVIFYFL